MKIFGRRKTINTSLTYDNVLDDKISSLMLDLHSLVTDIQRPKLKDDSWSASVYRYCEEMGGRISLLLDDLDDMQKSAHHSLSNMMDALEEYREKLSETRNIGELRKMYVSMAESYEEMRVYVHKLTLEGVVGKLKTKALKPINYKRNAFHAGMGLGAVLLYDFFLNQGQALFVLYCFMAVVAFLEVTRRFSTRWNDFLIDKVFGHVSRPFERHRTNSATYFLSAIIIITFFFIKPAVLIALLILAFADPAATITGKLFGRKKIFREKSYIGAGSFFVMAMIVTVGFLLVANPGLSIFYILFAAVILSLLGTATELLSSRVDDNFSIPIVCALAAHLLL